MKNCQTRKWRHPEGYKYLAPWTNAVLLRYLVRKLTATLPTLNKPLTTRNHPSEHRRIAQLNDACRSVVANIEEGFKRPTTKEYLDFLGYSQASLEEVKGDIKRLYQDGFLKSKPGSALTDANIDLKEFKGLIKDVKGNTPLEVLYPPLSSLKVSDLTLEMLMEAINKTDWLFRQLVNSLEQNISKEEVVSPLEKWRFKQMEQRRQGNIDFDRKILKHCGRVWTREGIMTKEDAERRGLKPL